MSSQVFRIIKTCGCEQTSTPTSQETFCEDQTEKHFQLNYN